MRQSQPFRALELTLQAADAAPPEEAYDAKPQAQKRLPCTSRGRGTGFAGPQAQRPPRGAANHTKWGAWGLPTYVCTNRFALAIDISMPTAKPSVTIAVPP